MSVNKLFNELIENSLNPCFNGRYSMSMTAFEMLPKGES